MVSEYKIMVSELTVFRQRKFELNDKVLCKFQFSIQVSKKREHQTSNHMGKVNKVRNIATTPDCFLETTQNQRLEHQWGKSTYLLCLFIQDIHIWMLAISYELIWLLSDLTQLFLHVYITPWCMYVSPSSLTRLMYFYPLHYTTAHPLPIHQPRHTKWCLDQHITGKPLNFYATKHFLEAVWFLGTLGHKLQYI